MPLHVLPEGQSVFVLQPQLPPTTAMKPVKQTEPRALAVQSVFDAQPQVWYVVLQADPDG
jgi:hypothetical protein